MEFHFLRHTLDVPKDVAFHVGLQDALAEVVAMAFVLREAGVSAEFRMMEARVMIIRFPEESGAVFFRLRYGGEPSAREPSDDGWDRPEIPCIR
jgi:hypothetical protein